MGTMNEDLWEDALVALESWFHLKSGGGFEIDSAGKIIQRLVIELPVMNRRSPAYQKRAEILMSAQEALLHSWLDICSHHPKSQLALDHAEQSLSTLLEMGSTILTSTPSRQFPIDEFVTIVNAWLSLGTEQGAKRGINMLLGSTDDGKHLELTGFAVNIVPCFEKALDLLIGLKLYNGDESSIDLGVELHNRMKMLKDVPGWEFMEIPVPTPKHVGQLDITDDHIVDVGSYHSPSCFEVDRLHGSILELVNSQGEAEKEKVEGLLEKLSSTAHTAELCSALTDFYARIGDAEGAMHWLQKLDQSSSPEMREELTMDRFHRVLKAWARCNSGQAPWRADELVRRMEVLENSGTSRILADTETYNILFGIWIDSHDPAASRKIPERFSHLLHTKKKPNAETFKLLLRASSQDHKYLTMELDSIIHALLEEWENFTAQEATELLSAMMQELAVCGADALLLQKLLQKGFEAGLQLSSSLCRHSLESLVVKSRDPTDLIALLGYLKQINPELELACYGIPIKALVKCEQNVIGELESVFSDALNHCKHQATDAEIIWQMLLDILSVLTSKKMYAEADAFLVQAERALTDKNIFASVKSALPLKCYQRIMKRNWYTKKNSQKVVDVFHRLIGHYNAGYSNLRPNASIFSYYIKALSQISEDTSQIENALGELLSMYEESGDESLRADSEIFNVVLTGLKQHSNGDQVGKKSLALLEKMQSLGIAPDTFTINSVIHNVIKSGTGDMYSTALQLYDKIIFLNLMPDSYTYHYLLDACGTVEEKDRDSALKTCLETLRSIREKKYVGALTYRILTKVLRRLLRKGRRADKVAGSAFLLCCEDGLLDSHLKEHFKSLLSNLEWEEVYTNRLLPGNLEPAEWSSKDCNSSRAGEASDAA